MRRRPRRSAALAVGDPSIGLDRVTYRAPGDLSQDAHIDGLPLGHARRHGRSPHIPARRGLRPADRPGAICAASAPVVAARPRAGRSLRHDRRSAGRPAGRDATRLPVEAGPHTIAVALVKRSHVDGADGVYDAPTRTPGISQITIAGPFNATGPGDTPSRRRLYVCTPKAAAEKPPAPRRS